MRELDGRYAELDLGPRHIGAGNFLSLNLGTDWDAGPGPDPVVATVRTDAALRWQIPRVRRTVASLNWGRAELVSAQAPIRWSGAEAIRASGRFMWGLTPLLKASASLNWKTYAKAVAADAALPWANQPTVSRSIDMRYRAMLDVARHGVRLPWNAAPRAAASVGIAWRGVMAQRTGIAALHWRHPALARPTRVLPWGPAKPLPWVVRPPVPGPDPDPDPEPISPPGNLIGLNLGCARFDRAGIAPLNLGVAACYLVRPQRRTYVVINSISVVRLPDRTPIEVESVSISSSVDAWGSSYDLELADTDQLALLKPTAAGPRLVEITLNGYVWTALIESYGQRREWARCGVTLSGRSRTALLAAPYAPGRVKATTEERSVAQLVAEELADTGFSSSYDTVDWVVPPGAWFYDATPALDAISRLAEASGAVVQSDPAGATLRVRARYPHSPWDWRDRTPDHVVQEDIVTNESLQVRSAPLYDAVVVTGELGGKGVTCKVRRAGEAGQLFAPQVSSPLINTSAAGAERGRNILADRGEQAAIELVLPLFAGPLRPGEVGRILPLDLIEVVGEGGTWHGLCTAVRTEARIGDKAAVIEQTITLERHYSDAD